VIGDLVLDDAGGNDGAEDPEGQQGQDEDGNEIEEELDPYAAILQRRPPWLRS
jgi:hypothetical protein